MFLKVLDIPRQHLIIMLLVQVWAINKSTVHSIRQQHNINSTLNLRGTKCHHHQDTKYPHHQGIKQVLLDLLQLELAVALQAAEVCTYPNLQDIILQVLHCKVRLVPVVELLQHLQAGKEVWVRLKTQAQILNHQLNSIQSSDPSPFSNDDVKYYD